MCMDSTEKSTTFIMRPRCAGDVMPRPAAGGREGAVRGGWRGEDEGDTHTSMHRDASLGRKGGMDAGRGLTCGVSGLFCRGWVHAHGVALEERGYFLRSRLVTFFVVQLARLVVGISGDRSGGRWLTDGIVLFVVLFVVLVIGEH